MSELGLLLETIFPVKNDKLMTFQNDYVNSGICLPAKFL